MKEGIEAFENYVELNKVIKKSSSKDGGIGFDKGIKIKVSDATDEEMRAKLITAAQTLQDGIKLLDSADIREAAKELPEVKKGEE